MLEVTSVDVRLSSELVSQGNTGMLVYRDLRPHLARVIPVVRRKLPPQQQQAQEDAEG